MAVPANARAAGVPVVTVLLSGRVLVVGDTTCDPLFPFGFGLTC